MTLRWIRALRRTLGKEVAKKISMRNKTLNVRKPGRRSCRARIGSAYDSPLVGYVRKLRVELIGLRHKRENQVTPVVGLQMAQSVEGPDEQPAKTCTMYVGREIYDPGWEIYDPVSYVRRGGRGKAKGSRYGSKTHDPAKTLQILDDPAQEAAGEMDEDKRDVYPVI
ncbi:hypothetical protein PC117_g12043 [Phytophthora cactorum]|uniref:Uncharacterized protein n=1 Tax=Phytophthora cactorum TaxID=29920 RepID=A0A8T1D7T1_9STRA|nr:hypothetical protein PC117_g12043 [Phytophthora cactorum]KAG4056856.1 hypothetical protein PC123_g8093 [Phytophthora cactorum]